MDSQIVFNPEFLLERNAEEDFRNTSRVILGGPRPATTLLKQFYSKIFPNAQIIKTDSTIAEMVKYLINSFLAVKVSFANEIYSICNSLEIDYDNKIALSTLELTNPQELVEMIVEEVSKLFTEKLDTTEADNHA